MRRQFREKSSPRYWRNPVLWLSCTDRFPAAWQAPFKCELACRCLPEFGIRNPRRALTRRPNFSLQLLEPSQSPSGLHAGFFGHFFLSLGLGENSLKSEVVEVVIVIIITLIIIIIIVIIAITLILIIVRAVSSSKPVPQGVNQSEKVPGF